MKILISENTVAYIIHDRCESAVYISRENARLISFNVREKRTGYPRSDRDFPLTMECCEWMELGLQKNIEGSNRFRLNDTQLFDINP